MTKCAYCNKSDVESRVSINTWDGLGRRDQDFYYCSDVCLREIEDFSEYVNQNAKRFLVFVGVIVLSMVFSNGLPGNASLIVSIAGLILGILLIKYPFATPLTNQWLGIKKAVLIVRGLGFGIALSEVAYISYQFIL
ncbi:MAG: hypothetical protein CVU90_10045 [Firmicutes bacterium HGW-Firmicutes-15]|nr:MAG: hypothetical protein CVU90_10045 [Firmicutes bacterium HGW-Firmicutes-15]